MKFEKLRGLVAAPFTPMHPDGSLNLEAIPDYYKLLKKNGVIGAFICGSTGEGVSLTQAEKKQVAQAWATATATDPAFTTMLFLGGTSVADCRELAQYGQSVGIRAVSFTAPYYFKPASVQQLAATCAEVASAVPELPFYYYHIPVLTGVGFAMFDLLQAIGNSIPNFAGIKYTHEDFMDFQSCIGVENGRFDMLWGRDENMLAALAVGAEGSVGSTFNYLAPLYHELMLAFDAADFTQARALQQRSIDFIRLLGKYGGIATGKAYMKHLGLDCGSFRLPVKNMTAEQYKQFTTEVNALEFDRFCSQLIA